MNSTPFMLPSRHATWAIIYRVMKDDCINGGGSQMMDPCFSAVKIMGLEFNEVLGEIYTNDILV
jgi:hypothetical protein